MFEEMGRIHTPVCPNCGKDGTVIAPMEGIRLFMQKDRPFIQRCFPTLSPGLREQIKTGIHPECWAEYLGPGEPSK